MRIFNKVMMIIILVCLAAVSLIGIVNAFTGFLSWADIARNTFEPVDNANRFIISLALLAVFVICVFLLVMESYRRGVRAASISSSKTGFSMITVDTIAAQIKSSVAKLGGLDNIKVKIVPRSGGIIINTQARLEDGQDIPAKMQEVVEQAAKVASEKLGLKVIKNNLTVVGLTPAKAAGKRKQKKEAEKPAAEEIFEEADPEKEDSKK